MSPLSTVGKKEVTGWGWIRSGLISIFNSFQDRFKPNLSFLHLWFKDSTSAQGIFDPPIIKCHWLITLIGYSSDQSLSYLKGFRSINKQLSIFILFLIG